MVESCANLAQPQRPLLLFWSMGEKLFPKFTILGSRGRTGSSGACGPWGSATAFAADWPASAHRLRLCVRAIDEHRMGAHSNALRPANPTGGSMRIFVSEIHSITCARSMLLQRAGAYYLLLTVWRAETLAQNPLLVCFSTHAPKSSRAMIESQAAKLHVV